MSRIRKIFDANEGGYDRPNQPWVCGHACEGHGCQMGPDKHGRCQAGGECLPRRQGDRWHCTRSAELGGPCADGPRPDGTCACTIPPCQPVRTLRGKRGLVTWGVVAATLGALLFAFGGRQPDRWINPGPLTNAHATSEATCADCHKIAPDAPKTGMERLIASHPVASENCLACHDLGTQPLLPHGRPLNDLKGASPLQITGPETPLLVSVAQGMHATISNQGIECATCHTEHHGRMADIRSIDDRQCQVCHENTFKNFAEGHPDFGDYPYGRRTRIIFDHASHLEKHFKEPASQTSAPTSCLDCHVPGDAKGKMLVKGFEQSCSACHSAQIQGEGRAGAKGIAFFRVPGLDVKGLADAGFAVGEWPEYAEGPVNPFIRLLLSSDAAAVADLALIEKLDLLDLSGATHEQQAAAFRTAWRIKSLFFDLTTGGQSLLMQRLSLLSGGAGKPDASLVAQLPADTLLAAKTAWWPHLFVEVPDYRRGVLPKLPERAKPAPTPTPVPAKAAAVGGDILGGDDILADAAPVPVKKQPAGDDILGDDILASTPAPAPKPSATEDILGDDILSTATSAASPAKPAAALVSDDILGGLDEAPVAKATTPEPAPAPVVTVADPESWMAMGGWYRSDDTYTLYYRPTGHADPFIKAWVDAGGAHAGVMPAALIDPKSPGMCAKCHSVDSGPEGAVTMNWQSTRFSLRQHEATKFSHTAHFSLLNEHGCQTCHVLDPKADYQASYAPGATLHHGNFRSMSKETCATCHQDRIAGNSCQLCHNYHQGLFEHGKIPNSSLRIRTSATVTAPPTL